MIAASRPKRKPLAASIRISALATLDAMMSFWGKRHDNDPFPALAIAIKLPLNQPPFCSVPPGLF